MLLKDMVIDKVNRTVTVQNIPVELTGKEFDLLLVLASNKGRVFTKKQLYTQVWTEEYDFDDNNIMAFISKLRKKIEPNPEQPFYIQTVRGVGVSVQQGGMSMELNLYLLLTLLIALLVIGYLLAKLHRVRGQLFLIKDALARYKRTELEPPCTGAGKRSDETNLL